jgi:hypothetical protein
MLGIRDKSLNQEYTQLKLPQTLDVEMTLYATVTITQEMVDGIKDQYPGLWEEGKNDPEVIARAILYASVGRYCEGDNNYEDNWDGVGDMRGLIKGMELA